MGGVENGGGSTFLVQTSPVVVQLSGYGGSNQNPPGSRKNVEHPPLSSPPFWPSNHHAVRRPPHRTSPRKLLRQLEGSADHVEIVPLLRASLDIYRNPGKKDYVTFANKSCARAHAAGDLHVSAKSQSQCKALCHRIL